MAEPTTPATPAEPVANDVPVEIQDAISSLGSVEGKLEENSLVELPEIKPKEAANDEDDAGAGDNAGAADAGTDGQDQGAAGTAGEGADTTGGESGSGTDGSVVEPPAEVEPDQTGIYEEAQVEDPGEFKPSDYSFEIKTTDGKTHKITSVEEADEFAATLDENPELITAAQYNILGRKTAMMEMGIANDQKAWETNKEKFDQATSVNEVRENTLKQIGNGMDYLQNKGLIPAVDPKLNTAEAGAKWESDYKDEPGVKERLELMSYMSKENESRIAAGLEPSFDVTAAYNAMELERMRSEAEDTTKTQAKNRQKAGSLVGGNAPTIQSTQQKGVIVGEGGSLNDLRTMGFDL